MRVGLHALRGIPPETVAVQRVVHRPKRDEGIVRHPGRAKDDSRKQDPEEQEDEGPSVADRR